MDICTAFGFLLLLFQARRLCAYGCAWYAVPCGSWVYLCFGLNLAKEGFTRIGIWFEGQSVYSFLLGGSSSCIVSRFTTVTSQMLFPNLFTFLHHGVIALITQLHTQVGSAKKVLFPFTLLAIAISHCRKPCLSTTCRKTIVYPSPCKFLKPRGSTYSHPTTLNTTLEVVVRFLVYAFGGPMFRYSMLGDYWYVYIYMCVCVHAYKQYDQLMDRVFKNFHSKRYTYVPSLPQVYIYLKHQHDMNVSEETKLSL